MSAVGPSAPSSVDPERSWLKALPPRTAVSVDQVLDGVVLVIGLSVPASLQFSNFGFGCSPISAPALVERQLEVPRPSLFCHLVRSCRRPVLVGVGGFGFRALRRRTKWGFFVSSLTEWTAPETGDEAPDYLILRYPLGRSTSYVKALIVAACVLPELFVVLPLTPRRLTSPVRVESGPRRADRLVCRDEARRFYPPHSFRHCV